MIPGLLLFILCIGFVLCGGNSRDALMMYYDAADVDEVEDADYEEEDTEDGESVGLDDDGAASIPQGSDVLFNPEEAVPVTAKAKPKKPAETLDSLKSATAKKDPVSSGVAQATYDLIKGGKL